MRVPARRADLVVRPLGERGQYVVKDPRSGAYFHIGEEERFLLYQLDGEREATAVCETFAGRFGEPLSEEDLREFLELAREQHLLEPADGEPEPEQAPRRQSLLYWRRRIVDPDAFLTRVEPRLRFFWSPAFVAFSAACMALAACVLWTQRDSVVDSVAFAWRWETLVLAWVVVLCVSSMHELAHGLTCKHFGGEVREIGFLLLYLMPCFYCNVTDAWLFREKFKRLWVTLSGAWFELFVWALAVFAWRLSVPDSPVRYVAFVVLSVSGVNSFFNLNPLIKLDGYYLLSDALEIPNLKRTADERFRAWARAFLWGAPHPTPEPRSGTLLSFGALSWAYSVAVLAIILVAIGSTLRGAWGAVGIVATAVLALPVSRSLFRGFSAGEFVRMLRHRRKRLLLWSTIASVVAIASFVPVQDRQGGPCLLRSLVRVELRAPAAGFVESVGVDEGDRVCAGQCVLRLRVPDLASRIAQQEAIVTESRALLRLLEAGPRPEEIAERRRGIERAESWKALAEEDLRRSRTALAEELARIEYAIEQCTLEVDSASGTESRASELRARGLLSDEEYQEAHLRLRVARAKLDQTIAERSSREVAGTRVDETELARRAKELADQRGLLALLEAGSRPEEVDAERARLARMEEELRYLRELEALSSITSRVDGVVTTARLGETVGHWVDKGDLLCVIEEIKRLEVEITLPEDAASRLQAGQEVTVQVRGSPHRKYTSRVGRISPVARPPAHVAAVVGAFPEVPNVIAIHCELEAGDALLRPGATGYARVSTGSRPAIAIAADRVLRFLRTEFWW